MKEQNTPSLCSGNNNNNSNNNRVPDRDKAGGAEQAARPYYLSTYHIICSEIKYHILCRVIGAKNS